MFYFRKSVCHWPHSYTASETRLEVFTNLNVKKNCKFEIGEIRFLYFYWGFSEVERPWSPSIFWHLWYIFKNGENTRVGLQKLWCVLNLGPSVNINPQSNGPPGSSVVGYVPYALAFQMQGLSSLAVVGTLGTTCVAVDVRASPELRFLWITQY